MKRIIITMLLLTVLAAETLKGEVQIFPNMAAFKASNYYKKHGPTAQAIVGGVYYVWGFRTWFKNPIQPK